MLDCLFTYLEVSAFEGILDPENNIAVIPDEPTPHIEDEETWASKIKQQPKKPATDDNDSQDKE